MVYFYSGVDKAKRQLEFKQWQEQVELAKNQGKRLPQGPVRLGDYYAMVIQPIVPYAIRGVLWDQGESGTGVDEIDQYTMTGALIKGWRDAWGQGNFPFLYVQKNSGGGCAWDPKTNPTTRLASAFASQPTATNHESDGEYRALHIKIMELPKTAMVTTSDLGRGPHPLNKSGYGRRVSRVALGFVYGRDIEIYGPVYDSHQVEGNTIRIRYKHVGKGLASRHADVLQGFEIVGGDGKYYWADAKIEGESVIVSSDKVAKPLNVRYAWSMNHPWANLFNRDGLPALTFSTNAQTK